MAMSNHLNTLDANGLVRFKSLQSEAVNAVTARFYATHGSIYERFGPRGQEACREDLAYHLEFLRPVLEFGLLQPMVDYLRWLGSVLIAREVPADHLAQSLDWLAEYYGQAMAPAEGNVVVAALQAARMMFVQSCNAPPVPPQPPQAWPEAARFEAALLAGNQRDALSVVSECLDKGRSLVEVEQHVIAPALYDIGEKWQANQVTVAQEHMATAIVQSVMTVGLLRSPPPTAIDKRVLLACVEGNNHAVGLRMVADAFLLSGWEVQYLGANMPTRALLQQVIEWKPDLVGLSVSFPQQLPVVKAVIAGLTEHLGHARPAVIVGGLAINRFNQLVDAVGADASSANAQAAVDSARRIVGR
jgi:methanogenic corrinoid protein MtbC1